MDYIISLAAFYAGLTLLCFPVVWLNIIGKKPLKTIRGNFFIVSGFFLTAMLSGLVSYILMGVYGSAMDPESNTGVFFGVPIACSIVVVLLVKISGLVKLPVGETADS